jgi:hypothetical protein
MALVTSEGDHMAVNKHSREQSVCGVEASHRTFSWPRLDTGVEVVTPPFKDS